MTLKPGDKVLIRLNPHHAGAADIVGTVVEFRRGAGFGACDLVAVHYKHPKTAIIMGHARGAVLVAADRMKIRVVNYAATMIKMALTGNGRARKEQVQRMVMTHLGLTAPMEPYDTSDALAAALCHINQNMKAMIS